MFKPLRKLTNALFIFLAALWTVLGAFWIQIVFAVKPSRGYAAHRLWGRGLCRLMGIRLTLKGLENWKPETAYVVAPNHSSIWDIAVLAALPREFVWISKTEVAKIPFFGRTMRVMGCHFLKRNDAGRDYHVMQNVERGLQRGRSVVIFPEGRRTRDGELLPLKKGAIRVAQNSGAPLLPIGIHGTFPIAPTGTLFAGRGHEVTVNVGKPVAVPAEADLILALESFQKYLQNLVQEAKTIG